MNYDFRQRLLTMHKTDIRVSDIVCLDNETELLDGISIILPNNVDEVILTAANDLVNYLFTSHNVSAMLTKKNTGTTNCVILTICDKLDDRAFEIDVSDVVYIKGQDGRAVAQAIYYIEDLMTQKKAPILERKIIKKKPLFSPRMTHSGYGLDQYPNEHLSAIAHAGMDAILVFTKSVDQTPSGYLDFNELIYRAGKYGIDVYAYSYIISEKHPDDIDGQEYYNKLYGTLFQKCPKLKGVVLVGESVEFPSKDPNVFPKRFIQNHIDGIPTGKITPGWWPCEDYPRWLKCIKNAVHKYNSKADIVFWSYNWGWAPEEDRIKLINSLPKDISLLVTYEMFEQFKMRNTMNNGADYTLAIAGPGKYFKSEAKAAAKRGIKLYAMANTGGLTWDIGVIPYEPMPFQWLKRYEGLIEAHKEWGLCGLMESHHFGFWPSFISDIAKKVFYNDKNIECIANDVIESHFGPDICIKQALIKWSEAITYYTPTDEDQYGAFRIGPSYPLCLKKGIKPTASPYAMFGTHIMNEFYTQSNSGLRSLSSIRIHDEIDSLGIMLNLMKEGVSLLESVHKKNDELINLINLGKFIVCCVQTGIHVKQWHLVTSKLKIESNRDEIRRLIVEAEQLANAEIQNAKAAIPLVEADSRLGWEPSMEYLCDAEHIRWKIRQVKYMLEFELSAYRVCVEI